MTKHLVLIADIESSRKVTDRGALQESLKSLLRHLNLEPAGRISPLTITLGDEFQAVYGSAERVFTDAVEILAGLHPQVARFSFGIGPITTAINPNAALEMDGPAFYAARDGMSALKKDHGLLRVSGIDAAGLDLVNSSLFLVGSEIRSWNALRLRALAALNRGLNVRQIAAETGVSDKAIYKTIADGHLHQVRKYLKDAAEVINGQLQ